MDHPDPSSQPPRPPRPSPPHTPLAEAMLREHQSMVTKKGIPIDPPDKGTGFSRMLAVTLAIVLAGMVIFWQNSSDKTQRLIMNSPPAVAVELTENDPAPGAYSQVDIMSRMFIKLRHAMGPESGSSMGMFSTMSQIDAWILSDEDEIRAVIMSAEFESAEDALDRLDDLEATLMVEALEDFEIADLESSIRELDHFIERDISILRTIYAGESEILDDADRAYIATRYAKLGKVALTHGLSDDHPDRKPLITGMGSVVLLELVVIFGILVLPLTGFILLVLGIVFFASGKLKFATHKPTRGGSVFLETYALFIGAFLVMALAGRYIADHEQYQHLGVILLPVQWALLTTVFWGLLRGMNFTRWRHAIGMHSGKGVFREIICGVIGYLAAIPIFLFGVGIMIVLLFLQALFAAGSGDAESIVMPSNPILEMIASGDIVTIVLIFSLATIWAPLCEELIFRGALYRHMHGYVHWSLAALGTAVLFAFMHNYGPLFTPPLIALGFMFAVLRQWRGSLIASMTAHFVHNFSLLTFMVLLVWVIAD
ncbi:MAG: CPBP family intramembrane metalloprotease [Phycisphaerales bacterium]|nr:CPBP family intramembrane metalloprotease [Phycisphaerales bacterium]